MPARRPSLRPTHLATAILLGLAVPGVVFAQDEASTSSAARTLDTVNVTGSRIKRTDVEAALPITIIQRAEIEAQGISSAEQLLQQLNIATSGSDSLAANNSISPPGQADGRGNNGLSGANLRGQGADATLVLLNGRRVAAHGLGGQVVDLNSIPFQAIDRVEVLRDGASAMYGTDAIGGVINFITRSDYQGLSATLGADVTDEGGGNIYRAGLLGGVGDLDSDRWNVWLAWNHKKNEILTGKDRDFTNSFRPDRGLSPDSRGGPFATIGSGAGTLINGNLTDPLGGGPQNWVNIADLPGGIGCENAGDLMGPYANEIWDYPTFRYACAWDYGRARTLQQASETNQLIGRFTFNISDRHQFYIEAMGSEVESKRRFEALQFTTAIPSTTNPATAAGTLDPYPLNDLTRATYDMVYGALLGHFGPQANLIYGNPIAYRWRCYECGPRQYTTTTKAMRLMLGLDGSIGNWNYTTGLSRSSSKAESVLTNGFVFTAPLKEMLRTGLINPFLLPGQSQTPEALAALESISADGTQLYSGETTTTTFDATFTGSLGFGLWAKDDVQAAFGAEWRREEYEFTGPALWDSTTYPTTGGSAWIYQAAGDANNYMTGKARNVKAVYAEFLVPVLDSLNATISGRYDDYDGFGGTFNPKYSFKWQPVDWLAFRGSYSTGFKVPDFAKLFRGTTESPSIGAGVDIADPATCPGGDPDASEAGCENIYPTILTGGNPNLKPEESEQRSIGVVFAPTSNFNVSVDWWEIERLATVRSTTLRELKDNYDIFRENWIRDASGNVVQIDQRYVNTGGTLTRGIEVDANLRGELAGGNWNIHFNGNYLDQYKTKTLETSPWSADQVGSYTQWGILPIEWKHTLSFGWAKGDWAHTLTQVYRDGYKDWVPRAISRGALDPADLPNYDPDVDEYITYNYSVSWTGMEGLKATFGIRNLLNTDPPFTVAYLDYGGGSGWEPRVADPRGRAFNLVLEYKFF
ncbi:TonB-dependent receptor domain-containing protein [Pseudoxanthomonas japonensis]|uniref:TonB-dependent receptor n=1 Tax=Pseudoxanthomonas japonensis TaxID=69284 RepID=A0ABQ6ZM78_9GAMM|nr:TonB-dependent receptor [Pseudoxanthomonas japonensis]KAF1727402.1 TonB-dependent receptor [Pseudoxanthomonas japonensis]